MELRKTIEKRISAKYEYSNRCIICGAKKRKGTLGHWYCPNKHGTGKGPDLANQPKSIPY